ncbi:PX domain-containing protein [Aspergillus sclerotialis]|uniref:PX domain-containing protein n=1 Tax=Aspergillus sclerotialis TaxID=2070753 RepID=A0A3A2Z8J4_9EURO|nr:PX domain-containing protein [Aspergillus sclerotialis]
MDGPDNADVSSSLSSKPKSVHRPDHKPLTIHTDNQARDQIPNFIPAKELKDSILSFLATSSGESLGCAIAALIAATYILLGRIGLVLIGLVLGVLLHASWEGGNNESSVDVPYSRNPGKRKELALDLANRLLDWPRRKPTEGQDSDNNDSRQKTINKGCATSLDYSAFGPMTSAALRSITDAAIKDYVM